jgi:glycosyltransferase involved in cell wall biosynthesis
MVWDASARRASSLDEMDQDGRDPRPQVAYVMTHYPKHSQTFLIDEVLGVHGDELCVLPIALNSPDPGDVESPEEAAERDRTLYVKAQPKGRIARTLAAMTRRDPAAMAALLARTVRSSGSDPTAALWSVFHLVEAAVVWDHCARRGCRHIHAQFGTTPATVAMLAAEIGNRVAPGSTPVTWSYTVHGYHEFTAEEKYGIARKTRSAAFVIAVSDYTRSQLMRLSAPADWGKLHRIRCGIHLDRFAFEPRLEARRPPTVVAVGRLSPEKGQFVLLDAARVLKDRSFDVRVKIVGDGPSAADLHRRARDIGVDDIVEFTGAVAPADVAVALADADVFCLASFAEGIPVSVMEALARGVPVVSTYVGGVPELVEHGVSGCTVPAGRPDLVADAIEALVVDNDLRARVQRQGRQRVEREHDVQHCATALRRLFASHV